LKKNGYLLKISIVNLLLSKDWVEVFEYLIFASFYAVYLFRK
jgi:hypothetical protein